MPTDPAGDDGVEIVEELSIVNEFGAVRIRKLRTRNGERLEIHSPRFAPRVASTR